MSLTTIHQAANDQALIDRITASTWQQAIANPMFGDTMFGGQVLSGGAPIEAVFAYPTAVDYEAAYESALAAGNPDPGGDPAVITDENIEAAVQAHWPLDAPPVVSPTAPGAPS
jgi:hypothetical protein